MTASSLSSLGDLLETELRDRYTIERELGAGGMARVWIATDVRQNRTVALKVLRPELALSGVADRFLREVRVLAELQHPHILALLDSGLVPVTPGGEKMCPFYVMPLVRGESLRERLAREGQLSLDTVTAITSQVAAALDYAHKRGVVHRDVKPDNLLLSDDQVYLADFGIASALEDAAGSRLTETGLTLGTPAYMSPEQAAAERRIDGRSDQYSLACVVYEMLAGEPPFSGPTAQAIIAKRLAGPAPSIGTLRPSLPAHVSAVMARALSQAPADRFPTSAAFAAALDARVATTPTGPVPAVYPRTRGWALGGVAVAALGLVLAFAYLGRGRAAAAPARVATPDSAVIELRERADRAYAQRTQAGISSAVELYSRAIARDSSYAPAWNGLARAYVFANGWGFTIPGVPSDSLLTMALRASDGAFIADSGLASTWVARAIVMRQVSPSSRVDVFRAVHRALAIDSLNADAWHAYAGALVDTDSVDRALEAWRRAVRLRPSFVEAVAFLSLAHLWAGQFDSAAAWGDSAIALGPTMIQGHHSAGFAALARGDAARAEREFAAAERLGGGREHVSSLAGLAMARAAEGDRQGARRLLLTAEAPAAASGIYPVHSVVWVAEAWGALGERDRAIALLRRFVEPRDLHFQLHLRHDPAMSTLRDDPRFAALLARK
ncbi:MAG: protein kinase [Gemmatimonadetes bacterium]|nr:protein kinase [Gemmatimonadota bacterium]